MSRPLSRSWDDVIEIMARACADGIYAVDEDQRITFWSAAAEELVGWRSDEVLGRLCFEVIRGRDYQGHPFCRRDCPTFVAARRGRAVPSYDVEVRDRAGRPVWLNMSIVPMRGRSRDESRVLHMFRDVTRRRRAEMLAGETLAAVARLSGSGQFAQDSADPFPVPNPCLTSRESEVLELLAQGLGTSDIARRLGVAEATARNHVDRMLAKLGVHTRLEAVVRGTQIGLL